MGRPITNHCLGLTCCIADAVIFVFNVSNYFRNGGEWMRGNTIDLRSEMNLTFFFSCLRCQSIKQWKTASNLII